MFKLKPIWLKFARKWPEQDVEKQDCVQVEANLVEDHYQRQKALIKVEVEVVIKKADSWLTLKEIGFGRSYVVI